MAFGLCPACCLSGDASCRVLEEVGRKAWFTVALDEGAADGRVLHHLGEEKQE